MRTVLRQLQGVPDHAGLAWESWAKVETAGADAGKLLPAVREQWIHHVTSVPVSPDYKPFFDAWRATFGDRVAWIELEAKSRLLIGHGNPSPSEVGLTLHHTWGVPVLPGSAIKGVVSSFTEINYGPESADDADETRLAWAGPSFSGSRTVGAPGASYRALFGAPDIDDGARGARGSVIFHDGLLMPPSGDYLPDRRFLVPDVLTVHHKRWYDGMMKGAPNALPNDWDDPNPVAFISVKPGCRFLVPVEVVPPGEVEVAPEVIRARAVELIKLALAEVGLGAKTRRGYGRLTTKDAPAFTATAGAAAGPASGAGGATAGFGGNLVDAIRRRIGQLVSKSASKTERANVLLVEFVAEITAASPEVKAELWKNPGAQIRPPDPAMVAQIKALLGVDP